MPLALNTLSPNLNMSPSKGTKEELYKWEDNSALDHKCGVCGTVLSNPKAINSCFGTHEEPCPMYHKTVHMIGKSHKCEPCKIGRETHYKRHKEIATLVQNIRAIDAEETDMAKRHRKKPSVMQVKEETRDDPNKTPSGPGGKRANKLAKRAEKCENRRVSGNGGPSSSDIEVIDWILHPEHLHPEHLHPEPAYKDARLDGAEVVHNVSFFAGVYQFRDRKAHAEFLKANKQIKPGFSVGPELLSKFGINPRPKASKARRDMVAELEQLIIHDWDAAWNDTYETSQRRAGYWRYVSSATRFQMMENSRFVVWGEGTRIKPSSGDE